jgi:hypothetical protein
LPAITAGGNGAALLPPPNRRRSSFAAPISPVITHFDNDATPDSLPLWCGGLACTYIQQLDVP